MTFKTKYSTRDLEGQETAFWIGIFKGGNSF